MNERIANFIRHPLTIPITVGVVSFGAGVGAGYILARKTGKGAELYELPQVDVQLTEDDLAELREEHEEEDEYDDSEVVDIDAVHRMIVADPNAPEELRERTRELLEKKGDVPVSKVVVEEPKIVEIEGEVFEAEDEEHLKVVGSPAEVTPVRRNAFAENNDDWDMEEELKHRSSDHPYVIHKDEFFEAANEYTQMTLTYYAGDRILVNDEDETPVYIHEKITGPLLFGHGTNGDPNVVYVRNDQLKAEYEILKDPGMYSVEVLGLEIENNQRVRDLKHMHEPPKMRRE
jgi:hypothetical protein